MKRATRAVFMIALAALSLPILNRLTVTVSGSQSWSFRDDFNYTSISQLQSSGWVTESIAPASYYSIGNSTLTLLNDGTVGAGAGYGNIPAGVADWSVSARVGWIGAVGIVSGYVGSLQVAVETLGHSYSWMADGYYNRFAIGMDGHGAAVFPSYTKQLNVWHILQLDMVQGTLYGYFDGALIGSYTEPDTSPGNTDLANIDAIASWETNNGFDWMQANSSPTQAPTPNILKIAGLGFVLVLGVAVYAFLVVLAIILFIRDERKNQHRMIRPGWALFSLRNSLHFSPSAARLSPERAISFNG